MPRAQALALVTPLSAPDRIMDATEISREKWHGKKSPRWVREHVPGKIKGSREALWFESTVDRHIAALRRESAA